MMTLMTSVLLLCLVVKAAATCHLLEMRQILYFVVAVITIFFVEKVTPPKAMNKNLQLRYTYIVYKCMCCCRNIPNLF